MAESLAGAALEAALEDDRKRQAAEAQGRAARLGVEERLILQVESWAHGDYFYARLPGHPVFSSRRRAAAIAYALEEHAARLKALP